MLYCGNGLTTLLKDKFLGWSKLKAFVDDKVNVNEKKICLGLLENIAGKGENRENGCCQHFPLFSQCFLKVSLSMSLKVRIVL